jgi:hypothetical protein
MISIGCGKPTLCQAIEFIILFKYALGKMKLATGARWAGAEKNVKLQIKYHYFNFLRNERTPWAIHRIALTSAMAYFKFCGCGLAC